MNNTAVFTNNILNILGRRTEGEAKQNKTKQSVFHIKMYLWYILWQRNYYQVVIQPSHLSSPFHLEKNKTLLVGFASVTTLTEHLTVFSRPFFCHGFSSLYGKYSKKNKLPVFRKPNITKIGMDFPPKRIPSGLLYKRRGGDSISTPSLGTCLLYFKSSSYTLSLLNFIGYNSTSSRSVIISNCSKPESTHSITSPSSFLVSLFLI